MEQIPKGQKFENWSQLYAVAAFNIGSLSFEQFIQQSLGVYVQTCGKENFKMQVLGKTEKSFVTIVFCENSPNSTGGGYGPGIGEITLFYMAKPFGTNIKIYHHWKGDSFDAADKSSWPVDEAAIKIMVERFKSIELSPGIQ